MDVDEHQSSPPLSPASLPSDSHVAAEALASAYEVAASHEDEESDECTPAHIMQSALLIQDENYVPEPPVDDDAESEWTSVEHTDSQTPHATTPVNDLSAVPLQCPAVSSSEQVELPLVLDDLAFSAILLSESEYLALPSSSGEPRSLTDTDGSADEEELKFDEVAEEHTHPPASPTEPYMPSIKCVPAALDLTKDEAYHSSSFSSPPHPPGVVKCAHACIRRTARASGSESTISPRARRCTARGSSSNRGSATVRARSPSPVMPIVPARTHTRHVPRTLRSAPRRRHTRTRTCTRTCM